MKKLMFALVASAALFTYAEAEKKNAPAEKAKEIPAVEREDVPMFWGFANYGIYSGYQLYGSIVNTEPTMQSYGEINANLLTDDYDFGFFGFGLWHNNDLTGKRDHKYRRAFNEFDFNLHWQKTFWFDDEKTWGLTYRSFVVWYYYPHTTCGHDPNGHARPRTKTTFDWDHSFELTNPYLIPYVTWVHEYVYYGNLIEFGVKKPWQITDEFSATPFIDFVWRDHNYGWCFSSYGVDPQTGDQVGDGLATMKIELDLNYQIASWIGVFAKVAYCQNLDGELRDACDNMTHAWDPQGDAYGRYNEFVWGGVGVCVNF